jgi:RNA polymerase sigma factor (sigma-70 family)
MPKSDPTTDLAAESDVDLIAAVALQNDDKEMALAALEELHARYAPSCLRMARFQDYTGVDPDVAVSKTFLAIWKAAARFNPERRRKEVSRENAAKSWIFTILKNELKSQIRDRAARNEVALLDDFQDGDQDKQRAVDAAGDERFYDAEIPTDSREEPPKKPLPSQTALLQELMNSLSEKEKLILDLSAAYIEPYPPFSCLVPKEELSYLAAQISVAPSSIKVLRQRAYQKLRKLAESTHKNSK